MKWDLRGWSRPHMRITERAEDNYRIEGDIGCNWLILIGILLALAWFLR